TDQRVGLFDLGGTALARRRPFHDAAVYFHGGRGTPSSGKGQEVKRDTVSIRFMRTGLKFGQGLVPDAGCSDRTDIGQSEIERGLLLAGQIGMSFGGCAGMSIQTREEFLSGICRCSDVLADD